VLAASVARCTMSTDADHLCHAHSRLCSPLSVVLPLHVLQRLVGARPAQPEPLTHLLLQLLLYLFLALERKTLALWAGRRPREPQARLAPRTDLAKKCATSVFHQHSFFFSHFSCFRITSHPPFNWSAFTYNLLVCQPVFAVFLLCFDTLAPIVLLTHALFAPNLLALFCISSPVFVRAHLGFIPSQHARVRLSLRNCFSLIWSCFFLFVLRVTQDALANAQARPRVRGLRGRL
jgi:hypothetical protein